MSAILGLVIFCMLKQDSPLVYKGGCPMCIMMHQNRLACGYKEQVLKIFFVLQL